MSTTEKYSFVFILPNSLRSVPIPFDKFKKPIQQDENGNDLPQEYYTYDEWANLPGNGAVETPSGTHAVLGVNVTSVFTLSHIFPVYLQNINSDIEIVEGMSTDRWLDEDQTNYLWIVSTDKVPYGFNEFMKSSILYKKPPEDTLQ